MSQSNDIAKGIYKAWLAITGTRLFLNCLSTTIFLLFAIFLIMLYIVFAMNASAPAFATPKP